MKAAIASGALLGAMAFGQPAEAHSVWSRIYGPGQWPPTMGKVQGDHGELWVCDTRADGIGVYVEYYLDNNVYGTFSDGDGAGGSCGGTGNFWNAGLHWFQGHSRDGGATGWIEIPQH